ncbi:MAG: PQQ-binding-like beta-propeller repeat protein [Deltaproteobacteria bacterium]
MRIALWVVAAVGCQQELPPPPVTPVPQPVRVAGPPFVLHDLLVAENGAVIEHLPGFAQDDVAVPSGPHRFTARDLTVDTETALVIKSAPPIAFDDHHLVRREVDGRARWTQALEGVRSVRPPDVAVGGGRALATIDNQLHAFDDATGKALWSANVSGDRLLVAGDTAYSVMCGTATDHWLIGTSLADGKERFRSELAIGCDPEVQVVNKLVIVTDSGHHQTRIFDLAGHQLARLAEVADGDALALGTTTILVSDLRVVALGPDANVLWQREHPDNTFVAGNALAELPGGDLVLANYGAISDSGVDLVRLRRDGSEVWHSCAAPLGVGHSEYEHFAYIEVRGDALFVASEGSFGAFLEQLAVRTGEREIRCVYDAEQRVANACAPIRKPCR